MKSVFVNDEIGAQKIHHDKQIIIFKLNRCCGQKDHGFCIITELLDSGVCKGFSIPDMMRLIHNDQIKFRRILHPENCCIR